MGFKLKSGNTPAFKKIGVSPLRQEKTYQQAQADSTASYNMQLEKNKLIKYHNREMLATNPSNVKGYVTPSHNFIEQTGGTHEDFKKSTKTGREMLAAGRKFDYNGNPINPNQVYHSPQYSLTAEQKENNEKLLNEISQHRLNAEKAKEKYKSISDKQKDLGVYLSDESFRLGRYATGDWQEDEIEYDPQTGELLGSIGGRMEEHTTSFRDPTYKDVKLYRPHSRTDDLRPKSKREKQQKIEVMASKNLEFMPTEELKLKKALPVGIRNDRYYTLSGVPNQSGGKVPGKHGNRFVLSDQAGREIERFKNIEEYQEKYGDALQRGTKNYGQENLKRRLYPKGYTKK